MHDEKLFACLAKDMLLALDCLYDLNMVHLDIKPSNILVGAQGHACLSDFGLARNVEEYRNESRSKFVGTMKYLSPDRLRGAPGSFGSDVWALGLSLLEAILGRYPVKIEAGSDLDTESAAYDGMQQNEQKDMYWVLLEHLDGDALALPEYVRVPGGQIVRVSDQLRDFLSKMLGPNDDDRPTARELLSHEWITSQADSHTDYADNYDRLFSNADFAEKSRVLGVLSKELLQKNASSTYRDCAQTENLGSGKESKDDLDELLGNGHNFDKMVACHTDQGNPPVEAYHVPVTHVRGLAKLLALQKDIVRFAFVNNALPTRVCFCIA
jgi:serine/threonine protein kinase